MGRKRTSNHDLPPRMHRKGDAYYHVTSSVPRKWTCLGSSLPQAKLKWAELEMAGSDEQTAKQGRPPETVRLYRYRDDAELWQARPDMRGLPVTAHAALLARVRSALQARGQSVAIEYA